MATEDLYRKFSATELSAIILKGSSPSNDRDTGFCSGSSEGGDDISVDHSRLEPHSPTDASEDSVEVKVTPICFTRNKRKSTEPSRVICEQETGPLKKRIRYTSLTDTSKKSLSSSSSSSDTVTESTNHFRPWDQNQIHLPHENMPNPAEIYVRHPGVTTLHRAIVADTVQDEPLALIAKKPSTVTQDNLKIKKIFDNANNLDIDEKRILSDDLLNCGSSNSNCNDNETIPLTVKNYSTENNQNDDDISTAVPLIVNNINNNCNSNSSSSSTSSCSTILLNQQQQQQQRPQQRNYKNMTRERRIEANARERTRVHTISAAYDTLRKSIPSYSHTQKLSKLSVLRVACSYILTLSRMAGYDYSEDQSEPSISQCFDLVTKTIQTEGKIRKKKDE